MRNIEIDDEVFGYLQSKAVPFVETPNLTLRRLFSLNGKPAKSEKSSSQIIQDQRIGRVRKKRPKTDLPTNLFKLVYFRKGKRYIFLIIKEKRYRVTIQPFPVRTFFGTMNYFQ